MEVAPHRPITLTLVVVLLAVPLTGCVSGDDLTFSNVEQQQLQRFDIFDLQVNPSSVNVGEEVRVDLRVKNVADEHHSAKVQLVANPLTSLNLVREVDLAPGEFDRLSFRVRAETGGTHLVTAVVQDHAPAPGVNVRVLTPNLVLDREDVEVEHPDDTCQDSSTVHLHLENAGDGAAKDVQVRLRVEDTAERKVQHRSITLDEVPGYGTRDLALTVRTPDACNEDDVYRVKITVQPSFGDEIRRSTGWFSV